MKTSAKKTQAGFTMVEVLISLTILATLMAAVAFAFDAAVTNYQTNKGIYETVNRGRQALLRITDDLRKAQVVAFIGTDTYDDPDNLQVSMLTADGRDITYKYSNGTLFYITNYDTTDPDYTLCENVTIATFDRTVRSIDRNIDIGGVIVNKEIPAIRDVRIVLTVTDEAGDVSKTLAAATMIRKNM